MSNRSIVRGKGQRVPANGDGAAAPALGPDFVLPRGAGSDEEGELQRYLQLIYSRRWFLLAAALLGLAVAAFTTFRQPRLYVAQATVEFKKATPPGKALNLDLLGRSAPIPPLLATRLLTTKILAARIIKAERIRGVDWFDPPATSDAPRSILAAAWSAVASGVSAVRW
ncbi:MAG: hypothetical protein ACE5I7_15085, partial [Candidatus Binatia bacterium]